MKKNLWVGAFLGLSLLVAAGCKTESKAPAPTDFEPVKKKPTASAAPATPPAAPAFEPVSVKVKPPAAPAFEPVVAKPPAAPAFEPVAPKPPAAPAFEPVAPKLPAPTDFEPVTKKPVAAGVEFEPVKKADPQK